MSKNIAYWAHLIRDVGDAGAACLTVIILILEIADKIANCNVQKLRVRFSG